MKGEGMENKITYTRGGDLTLQHVRIGDRNFAGEEKRYNPKGVRNFRLYLDDELLSTVDCSLAMLIEDGWNVKSYKRIDDEMVYYIDVTVRYDVFPPKIVVVSSTGRQILSEESVKMLDTADLLNVDITVHPRYWSSTGGKSGLKAYVKVMYVVLDEDPLDLIYNQQ